MNKAEAAKYLGCSESNLQRLMTDNKIGFNRVQGKYGPQVEFDQVELDRYKSEREQVLVSPAIENYTPSTALTAPSNKGSNIAINTNEFTRVIGKLVDVLSQQNKQVSLPISEKLLLNIEEVTAFTGLSSTVIRKEIKEGRLKAIKIGKGWRMKKEDLEMWVEGL